MEERRFGRRLRKAEQYWACARLLAHACRKLDVSLAMVMRWPRREFGTCNSGIKRFLEVAAEILGLYKAATDRTSERQILIEVSEGHSFSATKATR